MSEPDRSDDGVREGIDARAFADRLEAAASGRSRLVAALCGPPGAGKSTIGEAVVARLNRGRDGFAALVPMDGLHYDDAVLAARGRLAAKGAPDTFDVGGLRALLERLGRNDEEEVAVPLFDRELEISRAGARIVPRSTRVVLVEGNYLLLRSPPWSDLAPLFDVTAMIGCTEAALRERLVARWLGHGLDPEAARAKAEGNDLANGRLVLAESRAADITIDGTAPL